MEPSPFTPFTGTATYYARYRPAYPEPLLADLRSHARTSGRGSLLDLACGPGRVAIPMAPYFQSVLGVDVEPEMLVVGEEEASRRGVTNITWVLERAEDLDLPSGSVELITIGEAFHRLDRDQILNHALRWLQRGGALATIGAEVIWGGKEEWKRVLVDVMNKWLGTTLGDPRDYPWGGWRDELSAAGFAVEEHEIVIELTWTCDSIVGFLFSTSIASRRVLGDKADAFESDLRESLSAIEPSGRFASMQRFGFTLGTT